MKLLFDANLSPRLVWRLEDLFPGSAHVFDMGLATGVPDVEIWEYARTREFTIVTADSDFLDLARRRGAPPKVVHLENRDYRPAQVEVLLRRNCVLIAELERSTQRKLTIRRTR